MTDTINVPRKLLERIIGKMNIVWQKTDETEELRALLQAPAQPAPVQGWQMVPDGLTMEQKLQALASRFYGGVEWNPKAGDHYTTSRADLELYRVAKIEDGVVYTEYCTRPGVLSEWPEHEFTTAGFGPNRVHVPEWILAAAPQPSDDAAKDAWIPVGERLPEYGQEVIVNSNFDGVCAGVLDSYDEWFAPCSEYKLTRITHWMPLPAAPAIAAARKGEGK